MTEKPGNAFASGFGATLGVGAGCLFMVVMGFVALAVCAGAISHSSSTDQPVLSQTYHGSPIDEHSPRP